MFGDIKKPETAVVADPVPASTMHFRSRVPNITRVLVMRMRVLVMRMTVLGQP
jgi:hypothetical protein